MASSSFSGALVVLLAACAGTRLEVIAPVATQGVPSDARTHEPSPPEEARAHRQACEAGDPAGCHAAGLDHFYAPSDEQSDRLALHYFQAGCDAGYQPSCNGLGVLYQTGRGVEPDSARAVQLYEQACEAGVSTACVHLDQATR